jgi:hypothetical protein
MLLRRILSVGCLVALFAAPQVVWAQATDPQGVAGASRFQLGPLGISPTLTVGNLGVDTNVFNTPDNPTRDFTVTFTPAANEALPIGRLLLTGLTGVPLTYFQKSTTQRSVGFQQSGRVDAFLIRFRPYAAADYNSSYQRPNAEIDARVQQVGETQEVGAVLLLGARTSLDAGYSHATLDYASAQVFGADIAQQLNRRSTAFNATFSMKLTAITTFTVKSTLQHDRFDSNPLFNSNSLSLIPGFTFRKDSRLSGTVSLGVRALRPISPFVPKFTGIVGSTALSWLVRDTTRIDGKFDRNVDYSIDQTTPYFVATATSLSVSQIVVGHVDAIATVSRGQLAYRDELSSMQVAQGRTDRQNTFSIGSGYRFRIDARLGFNVLYSERLSTLDSRKYSGFQFGGTMSYGF